MPLAPLLEAREAAWHAAADRTQSALTTLPDGEEPGGVLTLADPRACSLAHFSIKGPLGSGSFSTIRKAAEKGTGKIFAIKEVDKHFLIKEKKAAQAKVEMDALVACRECPLVLKLFCTFQTSQSLFYVLEFCLNRDLQHFAGRYGALAPPVRQFYAAQIVAALGFLQAHGVVHRDLKPENIMLNHHMHVRLGDFACARLLGGPAGTRKNSFVGTAEYVAPEVLNSGPATTATDLWSLGAILGFLATGAHVFAGETEYMLFQSVSAGKYTLPEALPADDADIIRRLLVVDPTRRLGALEAGGIAELQKHPFFAGIAWESISEAPAPRIAPYLPGTGPNLERLRACLLRMDEVGLVDAPQDAPWDLKTAPWIGYLREGETALREGLNVKQWVGYTAKPMVLVLTSMRRMLLMDYPTMGNLKEVDMDASSWAECWTPRLVLFHLPKKTYYIESEVEDAFVWEQAFAALLQQ